MAAVSASLFVTIPQNDKVGIDVTTKTHMHDMIGIHGAVCQQKKSEIDGSKRLLVCTGPSLATKTNIDWCTVSIWWLYDSQLATRHSLQLVGIAPLGLGGLNIGRDCLSRKGLWARMTGGNAPVFQRVTDSPLAQP